MLNFDLRQKDSTGRSKKKLNKKKIVLAVELWNKRLKKKKKLGKNKTKLKNVQETNQKMRVNVSQRNLN